MQSISPINGKVLETYSQHTSEEVDALLEKGHNAFLSWRETTFPLRAELILSLAKQLSTNNESLSHLMTAEMGKPILQSRAEIEKCVWACEYYARHAESMLQSEVVETEATKSFVSFQPIGAVFAVMPWNFPLWQVMRFAVPAIMAGNTAVLKHASNVCGCALAIEKLFIDAGFPPGIFTTLLINNQQVAEVIASPFVHAVTLTGSTNAGKSVAMQAGKSIKKSVLELGGNDPYIILEDADINAAVDCCVKSRLNNSGQTCIAAKRYIVVKSAAAQFKDMLLQRLLQEVMGDPFDEKITIGPLARFDLRDELHQQVKDTVAAGASCLLGGEIPDSKGAYYPVTLLTGVTKDMPAYAEELFGPVAVVIVAEDEVDAIRIANDSCYGLGAAIFTQDIQRGERIASQELDAGFCAVNNAVHSDPRLPFGGIKQSGYGRELSHYGIKEFVNIKSVVVA